MCTVFHVAQVRVWGSGRQRFIGSFQQEIEAARAYDRAVLRLRGQDARSRSRMNFPIGDYNLDEIAAEAAALAAAEAAVSAVMIVRSHELSSHNSHGRMCVCFMPGTLIGSSSCSLAINYRALWECCMLWPCTCLAASAQNAVDTAGIHS